MAHACGTFQVQSRVHGPYFTSTQIFSKRISCVTRIYTESPAHTHLQQIRLRSCLVYYTMHVIDVWLRYVRTYACTHNCFTAILLPFAIHACIKYTYIHVYQEWPRMLPSGAKIILKLPCTRGHLQICPCTKVSRKV